jgi:undecaprenyl diphosphate synthase
MDLMRYVMRTDLEDLHAQGVKLRIIGDRSRFAPDIAAMMDECEALTQHNLRLNLNVAVNYGGRWDIVEAAKKLAAQVQSGEIASADIDESMLHQHMSLGDLPEPDLLIRTGGDFRVSNFLLWDIAYTELYFTEAFWPEFDGGHLCRAVDTFSARLRRFGRRP